MYILAVLLTKSKYLINTYISKRLLLKYNPESKWQNAQRFIQLEYLRLYSIKHITEFSSYVQVLLVSALVHSQCWARHAPLSDLSPSPIDNPHDKNIKYCHYCSPLNPPELLP